MRIGFELNAEFRNDAGKGASRRLRRAGKVPAILYGGAREPRALALDHQKLLGLIDNERFFSSIINLRVGELTQAAIVKDLQMHPARNAVLHVDLQRIVETEKIRIRLPIHLKNANVAPGVKSEGGVMSHRLADTEVSCLPKDLPEFLELDLSTMHINETRKLSDIPLPPGVTLTALTAGNDMVVAAIHAPRAEEPEPTAEAAAQAAAAPAAGAAPASGTGAAPAAEAKKAEPAKDAKAKK
ncbi:MAG: 50S ribosomal protein L25/general stress protein Ctc [Steroidobacteraceae bacterium]|nr:50S ribosomal protein L25/general stress protein Ctc [Steroidobacteraceae bacterium]MDW8260012.1 50S ribosomal protein L25/general stress protein Ctc [Gammaproteobacteria bacterium]